MNSLQYLFSYEMTAGLTVTVILVVHCLFCFIVILLFVLILSVLMSLDSYCAVNAVFIINMCCIFVGICYSNQIRVSARTLGLHYGSRRVYISGHFMIELVWFGILNHGYPSSKLKLKYDPPPLHFYELI